MTNTIDIIWDHQAADDYGWYFRNAADDVHGLLELEGIDVTNDQLTGALPKTLSDHYHTIRITRDDGYTWTEVNR